MYLWGLYWVEGLLFWEVMGQVAGGKRTVWGVLTAVGAVVSLAAYGFYERLLWLWARSHLVSMGYILLQMLLFWGAHAVYLSEALTILD